VLANYGALCGAGAVFFFKQDKLQMNASIRLSKDTTALSRLDPVNIVGCLLEQYGIVKRSFPSA
jgi:hypothetical protein